MILPMTSMYAVILTGSRDSTNPLIAGTGLESKVMLPVGGKPMVQSVFEAIAATKYNPLMYLSSNDPTIHNLQTPTPFTVIPSEARAVASFLKSLERVPADAEWVLFVSGDHALITSEMIEYFVDNCQSRQLALGVAVVGKSVVDRNYPESKRTYMPLKGDSVSGGNMYLIHKPTFMGNAKVLDTIDTNRKKPWKSVFMLNPWQVFCVLTRQVDIHGVAELASKIIGCKTGVVEMPFAECCMDVDKHSDKEIAERILANRKQTVPA